MATNKTKTLYDYFSPEKRLSAAQICFPIIEELIASSVATVATGKRHSGKTVRKETFALWLRQFPWLILEGQEGQTKLKCNLCIKGNIKNVWAEGGSPNIQRSTIESHNDSVDHTLAYRRSVEKQPVERVLAENTEDYQKANVTNPDLYLVRTVYTLMKTDIALDKVNAVLELQRLNGLELPYRNLSWTTINEIQLLISDLLKKQLVEKVNSSEYYAILIDESTDISVSKRLSICVRYVTDGSAETSFLGNCELVAGDAHTITETLHKFLESCGIDMSKCISLATDGASVMMGRKSGVGVQLVSKYSPFLTQTHCVAHRLNLAVTDSIKNIDTLKKFKDKFSSIYNYMSASANRCYELKNMQKLLDEPELTIKEPYSIRWLGLKRAVEAVYESYGAVLATLSSKASENATAKGLYKYFANYKTALLLGLMIDVHSELAVLSCQLQSRDIMFTDVAPLIESTVGKLEIMKIQNGSGLADMKASIKIEDGKAFYHSDELKYHSKEADSQFENVKINYLNNLCKNIRRRIRKHDCDLFKYMSQVLEPSTSQHLSFDETIEAAEKLAEHFGKEKTVTVCEGDLITGVVNRETVIEPLLDGEKLIQECHGLHGMRKGTYRGLSLYALSQRIILKHMTQFPNLAKLAKIALCTQVTSVECERSFSTQNRIKSKFRSSIGNEALDSLLFVSLCGPSVVDYNPLAATKQWLGKKRRRKRLAQEYQPRSAPLGLGAAKRQKSC